ncbi:c-type cytochrome [Undibacterium sp.]|jgi:cytochrome c553|uniref:c-type cytochrome n=1 Tax=Undibacterium sp. TaxID=1914977 RepID=UPI002C1DEF5C|nr:c-type cytochrome [Undibacterium sp.]HTD05610.1 c-type cytochrome [Undibacterium sp.]
MSAPEIRLAAWLLTAALAAPALAQQASVARGQQIAAQGTPQGVAACIGCHGARGEGSADFPRLAGSGQSYLQAQLDAFADGSRKNPIMQPFAQKLSATERTALAMYYSQLAAPFKPADTAAPGPADTGAWLAARGRWADQLPACVQCHGPNGGGVGSQFPPLAGLSAAYITEQLQAWKSGVRPPGPLALMPAIAGKLSDTDIDAVARHYAGLPSLPAMADKKGQP